MTAIPVQTNHHFSFTVTIKNTPEKVWQMLTDVANWKQWDTELKEAALYSDFVLGAKGILTPLKGPKLKFYISEITPPTSYTFKTKMPVGWLVIKRTLKAENGNTCFTDDIAFTGLLKSFFGILLGAKFRKVLPEVMNNFKNLAEEKLI